MWKFQDFCITKILREINFEDSRNENSAVFATLGAVDFVHLLNYSLQKVKKNHKNKNSGPGNVFKWLILHLKNPQN